MNSLLGKKIEQSQKFLENGLRIPVTKLSVEGNFVVAIKTKAKDSYSAVQLGFEKRTKARSVKSVKSPYQFLREVRIADEVSDLPTIGDALKASQVFKPGDMVNVTGVSKGKGYAGGVKRYNFRGGPRTHGQSDRERAPGSIGSNTTPGRVFKGKRMAGRMGQDTVTVKNLQVTFVDDSYVLVRGLVPGGRNTLVMLKKVGVDNKFIPLYADKVELKEELKETSDKKQATSDRKEEVKIEEAPKEEAKAEIKEENKDAK